MKHSILVREHTPRVSSKNLLVGLTNYEINKHKLNVSLQSAFRNLYLLVSDGYIPLTVQSQTLF